MHDWGLHRFGRCLNTPHDSHNHCKGVQSLPGYGTAVANFNNVLAAPNDVNKSSRKYSLTFQYNGSKLSTVLHFRGTDPWLSHWCGSCAKAAALQRMQFATAATVDRHEAQNITNRCGRCVQTQQAYNQDAEDKPPGGSTAVKYPRHGTFHNAPPEELCSQHYTEAIVLLRQWLASAPELDQSALVQLFLIMQELARSSAAQPVQYFSDDPSKTDIAIHLQGAATLLGVMTAKLADKNLLTWFASGHKHFSDQLNAYREPNNLEKRTRYGSLPGFCRCLRTSHESTNHMPSRP